MILDGHIHIQDGRPEPDVLKKRMDEAQVAGGVLLSQRPASFSGAMDTLSPSARLDNLFAWAEAGDEIYPFFWIDPLESDALRQVDAAVERGVDGFKVICNRYPAGHPTAMRTFQAIADAEKPMLFHSGILWDGTPSSQYNRPANFEALLNVQGLRFALAHISWPWVDECIAVYGKISAALRRGTGVDVEMFIDTTPGTPPIYREDALTKLFKVGYDLEQNVFFGSDNRANTYHSEHVADWARRDAEIMGRLDLDPKVIDQVFSDNLRRFVFGPSED